MWLRKKREKKAQKLSYTANKIIVPIKSTTTTEAGERKTKKEKNPNLQNTYVKT